MIKHPSALASLLYKSFQSPNSSTTNLDSVQERSGSSNSGSGNGINDTPPRKHRSKRSHFLRIDDVKSGGGAEVIAKGGKS